jgi:hypothetical protein
MKPLNKGLKYNIYYKHKDWIKTLAIEADTAINKLHERDQKYTRQIVINNIQKQIKGTKRNTINNPIGIRITRTTPYKQYKEENKPKPVNCNQSR